MSAPAQGTHAPMGRFPSATRSERMRTQQRCKWGIYRSHGRAFDERTQCLVGPTIALPFEGVTLGRAQSNPLPDSTASPSAHPWLGPWQGVARWYEVP